MMSKLETMSGYRGGVVYRAADVLPATVNTWQLKIGTRGVTGHPRYDAFDAILLSIMRVLTFDVGLPASRAAYILNSNRDEIRSAVQILVEEQERENRWRWDGGPYLHIQPASSRVAGQKDAAQLLPDDAFLEVIGDRNSGAGQIIVPLPRNVCSTLLSLETVVSGDKPAHSED